VSDDFYEREYRKLHERHQRHSALMAKAGVTIKYLLHDATHTTGQRMLAEQLVEQIEEEVFGPQTAGTDTDEAS